MTPQAKAALLGFVLFLLVAAAVLLYERRALRAVHAPENQTESSDRASDVAEVTITVRDRASATFAQAARAARTAERRQPTRSRGVDRVPAHLQVKRSKPLPPALGGEVGLHPVTGAWTRLPYRNPDRVERLRKNGRLRAELRT